MGTNTQTILWLEELVALEKEQAKLGKQATQLFKKLARHVGQQKRQQSNKKYRAE